MTREKQVTKPISQRASDLLGLLSIGVLLTSFWLLPQQGLKGLPCPFFLLTSWPCPGCGLTRGITSLSHGLLWTSIAFHPFALPLYLWFWWRALGWFFPSLHRWSQQHISPGLNRLWSAAFWTVFVMFGIVRTGMVIGSLGGP